MWGGGGVFITTLDNNLSITQNVKFIKTSYMIMSLSSRTDLCVDKYHSLSGDKCPYQLLCTDHSHKSPYSVYGT